MIKCGHAEQIIFYYNGEEGTYISDAKVSLYESGVVHIESNGEIVTTHISNCEIVWEKSENNNVVNLRRI